MFFTRELNTQRIFENMSGLSALPIIVSGGGVGSDISTLDEVGSAVHENIKYTGYRRFRCTTAAISSQSRMVACTGLVDLTNFAKLVITTCKNSNVTTSQVRWGITKDFHIGPASQTMAEYYNDPAVCQEFNTLNVTDGVNSSFRDVSAITGQWLVYVEIYTYGNAVGQVCDLDLINLNAVV